MRRMCGRILTWLMIGASSLVGVGCNPPPKSPAGGGKTAPGDLELAPGADAREKGKAGAPHREDQKPREF